MAGRQSGGPPPPLPPARHSILLEDPHFLRRTPPPPAVLEERIAAQHREIQALLHDNQRLAANHVALKQELSAADQEVRKLAAAARKVREERELEVKEVYERSLKLEAEVRTIDALNAELAQVRADVQRLTEIKIELTAELKVIDTELERAKAEAREVPAIRADIESIHQELQKGRAAIKFEKKTQAINLEHRRAMEKNMLIMQREIERLQAELANAEKRARAAAAAAATANPDNLHSCSGSGYMGNYGSPNMVYGGAGPYPVQYPMQHQGQAAADSTPPAPYVPPASSHHSSDMEQTDVSK